MNNFSNFKVHRHIYSHCLFLSLLNAFFASTNSSYSLFLSWKLFLTECIVASTPDSSLANVLSVPAAKMMSSFSNLVIVLPVICHRRSPLPTGLMPLSFFFSGTCLHARRVDMCWCGMIVSVTRCLARVAILSASLCE